MDVYDSNIWIFGLTRTCAQAVDLLEEAIYGNRQAGVSAYIYDEVMINLQRSEHSQEVIDRAQTRFAEILHGNPSIHGPSEEEIAQMNVDAIRSDPTVQTMGTALGIQPKDVPVVVFAQQCATSNRGQGGQTTTIYTADYEFGQFDPRTHFEYLVMHYVNC